MELGWKLQRPGYFAAFVICLLMSAAPAFTQGNMTITFKASRSVRHLAGVVTYNDGTVVPGVIVAESDSTYSRVLESMKTDANGHFSFPHASLGSKHYLKIDLPAFQEEHLPVKIWPFAKAELRIKLMPGQ
jgi:hypothetical protein